MTTEASLPTIGRNIGDDAPPVFRSALRKTGGSARLGKIQTALLGSIGPASTAEDDSDELHRRFVDIARHEQMTLSDLSKLHFVSLAGEDATIVSVTSRGLVNLNEKYLALDQRMSEINPAVFILDTLADLFGGNENDRAQVRAFISLLRKLAIKHRCAVILLAHPSLTGLASGTGLSGSTAWSNSVRSRLYFTRLKTPDGKEDNPDARVLQLLKTNYGRVGDEIAVTYRNGVFVPDAPGASTDTSAKAQRVFVRLVTEFASQGRHVNGSAGSNYAPTVFADHPAREGVTKRQFREAMNTLYANGKIINRTIRENGKDRTVLAVINSDGR